MPRQECELAALVMHVGASDITVVTAAVLALWSRGGLRFAVEDRNAWKRYIHWPRSARAESPGLVVIESKRSALVTAGESGMPEGHAGYFERALADAVTFTTHAEIEHTVDYGQWQRLHEAVAVAAHATGASTMLADARSRAMGEVAADPTAVRVTCGLHAGAELVALVEAEVQMGLTRCTSALLE